MSLRPAPGEGKAFAVDLPSIASLTFARPKEEGKAFAVGLPSLASFAFVRPKGEVKAFAVGLSDLGLVTSLPSLCLLRLEGDRRGQNLTKN